MRGSIADQLKIEIGLQDPNDETEGRMAENTPVVAGHPDMDYAEHEATYELFLKLLKFVAIGVVCVLIFLAFMWG
jgi:hypothetical protein